MERITVNIIPTKATLVDELAEVCNVTEETTVLE